MTAVAMRHAPLGHALSFISRQFYQLAWPRHTAAFSASFGQCKPRRAMMRIAVVVAAATTLLLLADRPQPLTETPRPALQMPAPPVTRTGELAPALPPQVFAKVDPATAMTMNAQVPFVAIGQDQPAAFVIAPDSADFDRALDCLASAMLYEAGSDATGQAAVGQVVLNRVRHPAFPHSICGVVYQGSDRTTGCQFTFTCDGALARLPPAAAWQQARANARRMLSGQTDTSVGMATHYHTDWVYPYWSSSLDKIGRVGTHLFFRWRGFWGRRPAFSAAYAGREPKEHKLAFLSAAHGAASAVPASVTPVIGGESLVNSGRTDPGMLTAGEGDHLIVVDRGGDGGYLALKGLEQCGEQPYCKVIGWDRLSQTYGSPRVPVIATAAFLYVRERRTGVEVVLWDCTRFNRPDDSQCLSPRNRRWITFRGNLSHAS